MGRFRRPIDGGPVYSEADIMVHVLSRTGRNGVKLLGLGVALGLGACTAHIEERLDDLEGSLTDLRAQQGEQTTQMSALQGDYRTLQGRIEELEFGQNKRIGSEVEGLRSALSSLKRRVPPPASVPAGALDDDSALVRNLPGQVATRFERALDSIREGNFNEAIPLLQSSLDASAGQSYGANILFWLGVAYDALNDHRNALLNYNQIVAMYGKHPRAPLALLRQAMVFRRLGDKPAASATLKKLMTDHPGTAEAAQAGQILREMK